MARGPHYDAGAYVAEVVSQGIGESKTGTPFFYIKAKILGTPDDNSYIPAAQQFERTVYFYLSEGAMPNTVESLKSLGFTGTSLAQLDLDHPQAQSFVENQLDLYCQHEQYNGDWKEKWNLSRVMEIAKLEPKKLRQLDALFGKSLKANAPATPVAPPPTPPSAPAKAASKSRQPTQNVSSRPDGVKDYGFDGNQPEPADPSDPGITDDDIPF